MAVTLKDVAEHAGVSTSAVSRTFTDGASVSTKTRARVEDAARRLGYQPNALASSLTTGRTKLVGLITNNFQNPAFLEIFDLFTRGLQERGWRPLLVNLSDETKPARSVQMLRQYSVDGVVVASSTLPENFATAFSEAGIPVVHAFGRATTKPEVDVVGIDNIACGALAVRELIARGYRHLGFLGGPERSTSTADRLAGFRKEAAAHFDIRTTISFASDYSFKAGRLAMQDLISNGLAEAYFCGDDVLSVGALSALVDAGLKVPDDVGLMGLNDMEIAGWDNISLTTIRQPIDKIVHASLERMTQLIDGDTGQPSSQVFQCHVVERSTLRDRK